MIVIESTGRKLKDAIDNGLAKLGKTLAEVDVEVIDNGGLFRKAKVRITAQGDEPVETKPVQPAPIEAEPAPQQHKEQQHQAPEKSHEKTFERRERPIKEHHSEVRKEQVRKEHKEEPAPVKKEEQERKEPRKYEPVTPEIVKRAEDFVVELISKMGIEAKIDTTVEEGELHISLTSECSTAIGYHGEVLDSIEFMTSYVVNREPDKFYCVVVNCNNYREKRKESLIALANKMAAKCLKVRHKIVLDPMNSNERKIIHSALADNDQIITRSEGHDPNRRVVILCKRR